MPLSAQIAKLLTKGAQKLISPGPGAIMKHEPTLRVLTPEQEAASYATRPQSSYGLLPEEPAPITPVETPVDQLPIAEIDVVPPVRAEVDEFVSPAVTLKEIGYTTDNPATKYEFNKLIKKGVTPEEARIESQEGKRWLKEQREYAAEQMKQNPIAGIGRGAQTANIGLKKEVSIRTSILKDLPGARGEEAYRTSSPQAKNLRETVEAEGWKPDPVMVWVNYDGKVYIAEGNHRVGLAIERGEEFIPIDIRYFAGSEQVEGILNPKILEKNKALRLTESEAPIKAETAEFMPSTKEVKSKKGKTREEVEIQGGSLSSKLNEIQVARILDEHGIDWEYHENGGITAIEKFSKGPDKKKHFKSPTTLRTIRNWLGYNKGGVVDMRNGGKVGAAVVAASLMANGGQAMDMRNGGVVGMQDGGWLKETSKIASKVGDVLSDVVDDPSKWLKAGVGELFDREQLSGQPLLSSYDLPHAELGKLSEQTLSQKYFGDINRYREIWSMYHGSDPSLEKEIQFVMHQNIKGKAPKQKEIDRITNEIVLDFKGDRGTDPKAPEINTDILAEALRRIAYHETYGGKVKRQAEKGPARGWWQVEPKTAYNMLKGKKGVGEAEDQNFLGPKVRKRLLKQTGLSLKQINKLGRDEFNKLLENNQGFNATVAALNVLTKASQRGKLNLLY